MVRNGIFLQAYNAQAAVSDAHLIVAHAVSNQGPDQEHLVPMLERVNCGEPPRVFSADTGYFAATNVAYCEAQALTPTLRSAVILIRRTSKAFR
jgi:hypothetical protein